MEMKQVNGTAAIEITQHPEVKTDKKPPLWKTNNAVDIDSGLEQVEQQNMTTGTDTTCFVITRRNTFSWVETRKG